MEEKKKGTSIYFRAAVTFLILFVLPLDSIYFLSKGRDFNRDVFADLKDQGKIAKFEVNNQNNLPISNDLLYGRVAVVNFLSENEEKAKEQTAQIAKVHESFDDTEDVYFISFAHEDESKNLVDRSMEFGIKDAKQWSLTTLDKNKWNEMASDVFKAGSMNEGIVLVDTSLSVRHQYHGYSDSLIGNLVLHISKVIPKQKRRGL